MSMTTLANGSLPTMVVQEALPVLLSRPMPTLIHAIPAMSKSLKSRSGTVLRERRYDNLPTAPIPLGTSGLTPPPLNLVATNFDTQINWYGAYVVLTNQVTIQSIEDVLSEGGSLLSQCMRETQDQLLRDMLSSTASQVYCVLGSNGDLPTNITADDIQNVVSALLSASAMQFTEAMPGVNAFGTNPILPAFAGLGHTDLLGNLKKTAGWASSSSYPRAEDIFKGEYGTSGYVRALLSPRGKVTANASNLNASVYKFFITGKEAYQCVKMDTYNSALYYVPLGASTSDPLRQRQTLAMTFASGERIVQEIWCAALLATLL